MKVQGIEVSQLYRDRLPSNLPKFVRDAAEERGYGDSKQPLSLFVNGADIGEAFACAAQGNGAACVMAQAGRRIGAKAVYFYRTVAWVDFGEGPIVRFKTSGSIYKNVIEPFDEGDRESVVPGIYHLMPPTPGNSIERSRERTDRKPDRRGTKANGERSLKLHTERIVMAAEV